MAGHVAMSEGFLISLADWRTLCREAMLERCLTMREVDFMADLGEGYMAKLMCGLVPNPTWQTISRVNYELGIRFYASRVTLSPFPLHPHMTP
jgi:hypothetical protein